jgi:hypothetical protein
MKDEKKTKKQLIGELIDLRKENAELRRKIAEFEGSEPDYIRGVRIGEILIEMGCLTFLQLHRALQRQKETMLEHKRLGQIMVEEGLITLEERSLALERQQIRVRHYD